MKKDLQLLVIEDSKDDTLLLLHELEHAGYTPTHRQVDNVRDLNSALETHAWDMVICDHSMPGFRSLDALNLLREKQPDVPFIVVSGTMGEDIAVNIMKAGANDYVMKDKRARLVPSIERELREAESRRARDQAEVALKQNQCELEDFFDHAPVGLHWEGPDGVVVRVNETELAMLGYSLEEYLGHHVSEFHADKDTVDELVARLRRGETVIDFEAQLLCKDGTVKDVVINSNSLLEEGRFVHSRTFTRDITAHKQAQAAIAYLAAMVESSEDAIIGTELDGTIISWNAGAQHMYGYSAAEVKGRSISMLTPPGRPEEVAEAYEQIKRGEWMCRFESVRVRKDGGLLDVSLSFSPIKDADGKVVGVSAIERDISVVKREEMDRLKLIQELTDALGKIKTLGGLLPICASCKKIRDDHGYWQRVELYISEHTNAEFTHGLCPDCLHTLYPQYEKRK